MQQDSFMKDELVDVDSVCAILRESLRDNWYVDMGNIPTLRTYVTFKSGYETESQVRCFMSRSC